MRYVSPASVLLRCVGLAGFALVGVLALVADSAVGAEAAGIVQGRVVDLDGKPVAGARVLLFNQPSEGVPHGYSPASGLATDARGRFRAEVAEAGQTFSVHVTKGDLAATSLCWAMSAKDLDTAAPYTRDPIVLEPGLRLRGSVVRRADGRPVAGARVAAANGATAIADSEGRFRIDSLARRDARILVSAPGFASQEADLGPVPDDAEAAIRVEMDSRHLLRGRVSDEEGKPIREARLAVTGAGRSSRTAVTDAAGRYEVPGPPQKGGCLSVDASHPDFLTASRDEVGPLRGEALTLDLVLRKPPLLTGEVRGPDGRPIAGASVISWPNKAQTDGKGEFRIRVGSGRVGGSLVVEAKGCAPAIEPVPRDGATAALLPIRLGPGRVATGRVVDHHGRPVPRARLGTMLSVPNT